jgi:WD40 repeat protein
VVRAVAVSPDGARIATSSRGNTVRIWDAGTGERLRTLTGHTGSVSAVAVSPDGTRIATSGEDRTARIWEASSGRLVTTMAMDFAADDCAWTKDGRTLLIGAGDGLYAYECG